MLRQHRLHQASQNSINSLNTAKRVTEKKQNVVGKLSILIGNNRKGDIVIREGDSLQRLAKNFVISYGLKKEFTSTIMSSLEQLVNNSQKQSQQELSIP